MPELTRFASQCNRINKYILLENSLRPRDACWTGYQRCYSGEGMGGSKPSTSGDTSRLLQGSKNLLFSIAHAGRTPDSEL